MNWLPVIAILVLLLSANALYVAAEFATASARRSRLAQLTDEGNRMAALVAEIVENPVRLDTYIATCQLGITASSLILGYYGQAALSGTLQPLFESWFGNGLIAAESLSATVVLLFLTGLQVLFGELVPKNIGVRYPERLAELTYYPVQWSTMIMRPLIFLFNGSAAVILRLFGMEMTGEHAHVHAAEELLLLVEESGAGGMLDFDERVLLENTLQLREYTLRQVMTPRTRMLAAAVDTPCATLFRQLSLSSYSRVPLYSESLDEIVGQVHLKALLRAQWQAQGCGDVRTIMKEPFFLPESMPISQAFSEMQRQRRHMAIVLDEYGGVAGLVTLEDLLEEVFGEIQDEFDAEEDLIERQPDRILIPGDMAIADVNGELRLNLPEGSSNTLGGLIMSELGRIPEAGDKINAGEVALHVEEMEGNRVAVVALLDESSDVNGEEG